MTWIHDREHNGFCMALVQFYTVLSDFTWFMKLKKTRLEKKHRMLKIIVFFISGALFYFF